MRRKDREVSNLKDIIDILSHCNTIHIGINDGDYPYIVPVSFATQIINNKIYIYFHGAGQGRKYTLLQKENKVSIEADIYIKVEPTAHGITTRYKSVMGTGICKEITDIKEIKLGLSLILKKYKFPEHPLDKCKGLPNTHVFKIELSSITGKCNLPEKL